MSDSDRYEKSRHAPVLTTVSAQRQREWDRVDRRPQREIGWWKQEFGETFLYIPRLRSKLWKRRFKLWLFGSREFRRVAQLRAQSRVHTLDFTGDISVRFFDIPPRGR